MCPRTVQRRTWKSIRRKKKHSKTETNLPKATHSRNFSFIWFYRLTREWTLYIWVWAKWCDCFRLMRDKIIFFKLTVAYARQERRSLQIQIDLYYALIVLTCMSKSRQRHSMLSHRIHTQVQSTWINWLEHGVRTEKLAAKLLYILSKTFEVTFWCISVQ